MAMVRHAVFVEDAVVRVRRERWNPELKRWDFAGYLNGPHLHPRRGLLMGQPIRGER